MNSPNPGKAILITVNQRLFARIPIRTHLILEGADIAHVCSQYAGPHLRKTDVLFVSERVVAISQGRAYPVNSIKPTWLAYKLSGFVYRSPYGIGLGSPYTMQLALNEACVLRILIAAGISAVGKVLGLRGLFYYIAGNNINAIDGPCHYTIAPFNRYAKLAPLRADEMSRELSLKLGCEVVIIDANDLGVKVLGKSSRQLSDSFCRNVFRDNPLGQSSKQTPLCIVREAHL